MHHCIYLVTYDYCRCKYCDSYEIVFSKQKGYTNAASHVQRRHKQYSQDIKIAIESLLSSKNATLDKFFTKKVSEKALNYYGWLEWIVNQNLPFSFCEKPLTKRYTKLEPISTKTLKEYLFKVVEEATAALKKTLPEKFIIMYDGWTADGTGTHYVAVYAVWTDSSTGSVKRFLLSCQPLLNQEDYSAQSHIEYLRKTLETYGKTFDSVDAFSGDK